VLAECTTFELKLGTWKAGAAGLIASRGFFVHTSPLDHSLDDGLRDFDRKKRPCV
jgi:hypothetical protein